MMPEITSSDACDPISMWISPREMTTGDGFTAMLRELPKSGEMCDSRKSSEVVGTTLVDGEEGVISFAEMIGTMSGMTESTIDSLMRCFQ